MFLDIHLPYESIFPYEDARRIYDNSLTKILLAFLISVLIGVLYYMLLEVKVLWRVAYAHILGLAQKAVSL